MSHRTNILIKYHQNGTNNEKNESQRYKIGMKWEMEAS